MSGGLELRLATVLAEVLPVDTDDDGAVTVGHDGTLASLRVVGIADDLELVSLTQVLAWDLPLSRQARDRLAEQARDSQLGAVIAMEKTGKTADVMLRYNFPGTGLTDDALRTLILLVLDKGAQIARALTA